MEVLLVLLAAFVATSSACCCNDVTVLESFSFTEFADKYYQHALYTEVPLFASVQCPTQIYTLLSDVLLSITTSQLDAAGTQYTTNSYAHYKDPTVKNGLVDITLDEAGTILLMEYNVMAFEDGKFIIVHNCLQGLTSVWILTAAQFPSDETLELIEAAKKEVHEKGGPNPYLYTKTPQESCSY